MIIKGDSTVQNVSGITSVEENDIINFLQGAVYCWCKNRENEWFSLPKLMGEKNYFWDGTPMIKLWEKHNKLGKSDSVKEAGWDGGWLLKKMIKQDSRKFETKKENEGDAREYRWVQ